MTQTGFVQTLMRKTRRAFRRESDHRTRFANIAHLVTGNFLGSLLGLAAFALTARSLGPVDYGVLALIYTFTRVVERIVSFQSWQPLIKFGAELQGPEHRDDLRMLLKFGLLLDMGAAAAAFLVAVAAAFVASWFFSWPEATLHLVIAYSFVLFFQISGMPTAVQRMAGQFRLVAYGQLINSVVRVALCVLGLVYSADLVSFATVWGGTQVLGSLTMLALAFRTLRRQGVYGVLKAPLRGIAARFPGIWNFTWSANASLTLRVSSQELDTLLVGALADPASAGLYHIAKRIGRMGQQVGAQVQAVIYPDVTRLWAARRIEEFRRVVLQVEGFLLGFGVLGIVVLAIIVEPLLRWTAGPDFMAAAPLVLLQMVAVALVLTGSAARSALLAMGRQREVLVTVAVGTAAFHLTALLLIPEIGAMGGNIAHIVLGLFWTAGLGLSLHRALKAARAGPAASSGAASGGCLREAELIAPGGL